MVLSRHSFTSKRELGLLTCEARYGEQFKEGMMLSCRDTAKDKRKETTYIQDEN
jgi:hypothetical protein